VTSDHDHTKEEFLDEEDSNGILSHPSASQMYINRAAENEVNAPKQFYQRPMMRKEGNHN
jgi:hypothetical protein